jgi:hypothetical protein
MHEEIRQSLSVLVGLPLWEFGRAASLEWFEFGQKRTVLTRKGVEKEVYEYALHVQCAWRIACPNKVVVGSSDIGFSRDGTYPPDDFDWDWPTGNWRDHQTDVFLQEHGTPPLVVSSIEIGLAGGVRLLLGEEYVLELFPDASANDCEYWRLFQPGVDGPHFVVTSHGLDDG